MLTKKAGGAEGTGGASEVEQGYIAPLVIFDSSAWFQTGFQALSEKVSPSFSSPSAPSALFLDK